MSVKPIRFRIHPECRSLYVIVKVWPDKVSMIKGLQAEYGKAYADEHADADGLGGSLDVWNFAGKDKPGRKKPICGEIACHRERLNLEVVTHEVAHVALGWARRIGLVIKDAGSAGPHVSPEEERFCYAVGRMVNEFVWKLRRRKIW